MAFNNNDWVYTFDDLDVAVMPALPERIQEKALTEYSPKTCHIMKEKFLQIEVPYIEKNMRIKPRPLMLLRQIAGGDDCYDLVDLIKKMIQYENDKTIANYNLKYKFNLIYEIARNDGLKTQMSKNSMFNRWISAAKNIVFMAF